MSATLISFLFTNSWMPRLESSRPYPECYGGLELFVGELLESFEDLSIVWIHAVVRHALLLGSP